ncbi:hypothetical protein SKAU_G00164570 [Synaphobranchus kaupii]|uniref:Uncharacterized protein n=1 Tax=Synaphobranchus kaupii TaxID=118154 RepID=A0A9Q1FJ60_SYNKA|nr:hypothetical protein SKAU_G00164570 [Synaphobranchus kaupii]
MTNTGSDKTRTVAKAWIALKRLDLNDDRITALREIPIQRGLESATVRQIICSSFVLNAAHVILKIRNSRGSSFH